MHASVALADVWTVLERGLLLDRLKRARRRDPRRKDGAGVRAWRDIFRHIAMTRVEEPVKNTKGTGPRGKQEAEGLRRRRPPKAPPKAALENFGCLVERLNST